MRDPSPALRVGPNDFWIDLHHKPHQRIGVHHGNGKTYFSTVYRKQDSGDEKSIRSLRSLSSFITLGAWLGILAGIFLIWSMIAYKWGSSALVSIVLSFAMAGALFWCGRLLDQKRQLAITIYIATIIASWFIVLITRVINSRTLFASRDLISLIVPVVILFEMYRLRRKGLLV